MKKKNLTSGSNHLIRKGGYEREVEKLEFDDIGEEANVQKNGWYNSS